MNKIFIETERIYLLQPSIVDFEDLYALQADPEVMEFFGGPRAREKVWERMHEFLHHYEKHGFSYGNAYLKDSHEFIGRAGLIHFELNDEAEDIELGCLIVRKYWGNGYATEIGYALKNYAFNMLKLDKVCAAIDEKI